VDPEERPNIATSEIRVPEKNQRNSVSHKPTKDSDAAGRLI